MNTQPPCFLCVEANHHGRELCGFHQVVRDTIAECGQERAA